MDIAVVEKPCLASEKVRAELSKRQQEKGWHIDYFRSGKELLSKDPYAYNAVLIDHSLEDGSENLILNVLTEDRIDLAVMNGPASDWFRLGLVQNGNINALIDKTNPKNVIDWLNYVDVKHRLTNSVKRESGIYSEIVSNTNGCVFYIKEGVTVLGVSRLLSKERIDIITKSIESTNNRVVIYFTDKVRVVSSSYFGLLVTFWERVVQERRGKMAFWMRDKSDTVVQMANLFCIKELFPCFFELDEAIEYMNTAEQKEKRKRNNGYFKRSYA